MLPAKNLVKKKKKTNQNLAILSTISHFVTTSCQTFVYIVEILFTEEHKAVRNSEVKGN